MGIGAAIGLSTGVGLVSSYFGAKAQRDAASKASDATRLSTEKNLAFQKWLYGENVKRQQPWVDVGKKALKSLEMYAGQSLNKPPTLVQANQQQAQQPQLNQPQQTPSTDVMQNNSFLKGT